MTTPLVIGLDLSLNSTGVAGSGWAEAIRNRADLRGHARLQWLHEQIGDFTKAADLVVIEGLYLHRATMSQMESVGAWFMITHSLWRRNIPTAIVPPMCRAKYATGNGHAGKGEVRTAVQERYGVACEGAGRYDQADAMVLAAMGYDHLGLPLAEAPDTHRIALSGCTWPDLDAPCLPS